MHDATQIDVRPLLAKGIDPLQTVLERAAALPADAVLRLEAPFDPQPLRRVLAGKGFSSEARRQGDGHWQVIFRRDGLGRLDGDAPPPRESCPGTGEAERDCEGNYYLDLRGQTPPQPLLAILRLCSGLDGTAVVVARLDRDPIYLYPELAEIGWTADTIAEIGADAAPGEVVLRLCRREEPR